MKIPFVFTLEASFAGASRGKLAGQHFSLGDLENIGKTVLKAVYYARNAEINKRLLRDLSIEADSCYINDDGGDSDGDGSSSSDSEDDKETDKLKKALEDMEKQI